MNPTTWQRNRRLYEVTFWVVFFIIQTAANGVVAQLDIQRNGLEFQAWEPWVWEISSTTLWLALIPVLLVFDRRFPIQRPALRQHLVMHLLFTIPFSLIHVVGMVALRELAYWFMGSSYNFGNWPRELTYEYLKDIRTYGIFLALIYLYRFLVRRWQGEARFLAEGREETSPNPVTDRFLVKKLGREFLVRVRDIDWVESAGNYVTLHVGERLYPLRETMTNIEQRLADQGFARIHRSAIVNLDRVHEIEPLESGDAKARLSNGEEVAISRRYKNNLTSRLSS